MKPIQLRSLLARLNHHLAPGSRICKTKPALVEERGEYHLVIFGTGLDYRYHVDPVALARELKVLGEDERVVDDPPRKTWTATGS